MTAALIFDFTSGMLIPQTSGKRTKAPLLRSLEKMLCIFVASLIKMLCSFVAFKKVKGKVYIGSGKIGV